jgi:(p)ppGpp synthase/HD superfamily hydrolase
LSDSRYPLIDAAGFAAIKHGAQRRKYSGDPYITHLMRVAQKLESLQVYFPVTDDMLKAALLHDVLEDTDCTPEELRGRFGDTVASYVADLTINPVARNRRERYARYTAQLAGAPLESQLIKACDLWDNAGDIRVNDPDFYPVYLREALQIARALDKIGPVQARLIHLLNGMTDTLL